MTATYDEQHVNTTHTTEEPVDVDLIGSDYLRWLYGSAIEAGVDGHIIASRMVGHDWRSHSFTLDDLDKIDEYVERYGDRNLYLRSTLLARPLAHEGERGGKHEDGWLTHYVADVDFVGGAHASDNLPTEEEALTILAKLPKASALIHSGGGYYAVWRLAQPFPLDTEQARATATKIGKRIDNALNSHGRHVDRKCQELAAVSRPPGTLNHKYSPPKVVYLLTIEPDVVYTLDDLDKLLPPLPTQEPKPAKTTSSSSSGSYADIFADKYTLADVLQADTVDRWHHVATTNNEERWKREGSANAYGVKQFVDTGVVQIWSDSVLQRLGLADDEKAVSLYRFACLLAGVDDNRPQDAVGSRLADMIRNTGEQWRQQQPDGNSLDWITEQQDGTGNDKPANPPSLRPTLPEEFWTARPTLTHIREIARACRISPAPLLAQILARVSAMTPPSYCVPAFRNGRKTLSFFVVHADKSGAGKSGAAEVAAEVLGDPPLGVALDLPIGSGEGIQQSYLTKETVKVDGKKLIQNKQVLYGAHFSVDEGSLIQALAKREASTLVDDLKTMYTSGTTGRSGATLDTTRRLNRLTYNIGLSVAVQPAKAGFIFGDLKGGFPQRFLFVTGGDPGRPDERPPHPGALPFRHLPCLDKPLDMTFPAEVWRTFDEAAVAGIDGTEIVDELDGHRGLITAKAAGLLAALEHRYDVTLEDWRLAVTLVDYSEQVRTWLVNQLRRTEADKERSTTERLSRRAESIETKMELRALQAAANAVGNKAHKSKTPLTRRDLHHAIASKYRAAVTVESAIEEAVRRGYLTQIDDGTYTAGEVKP